jgi:hypothetical protein
MALEDAWGVIRKGSKLIKNDPGAPSASPMFPDYRLQDTPCPECAKKDALIARMQQQMVNMVPYPTKRTGQPAGERRELEGIKYAK